MLRGKEEAWCKLGGKRWVLYSVGAVAGEKEIVAGHCEDGKRKCWRWLVREK